MTRRRISAVLLATALALVVALSIESQSAVPLFTETVPPVSGEGRPEIVSIADVVINMDDLKTIPTSLSIELPPDRIITATLVTAERRWGFDASGVPELPNEQLQFFWHGRTSAGGDVILTVVDGVLTGRILGPDAGGNFVVRRALDGDKLVEVDVSQLPLETADGGGVPPVAAEVGAPGCSTLVTTKDRSSLGIVTDPDKTTIEVLVIFTEEARKDAGEDELDQDDDDIITSLIVSGADETTVIYSNSEIDAEVEVVHIARYEGFQPTGDPREDLFTLVDDPCIQALRREARADIVSVIVRDAEPYGPVRVCGQAVVQRPGCRDPSDDPATDLIGCDPGIAFQPFAYNFVAVDCLSSDFVFGHEITHCLGGEHCPGALPPELAFLPDSFGWNFLAQALNMMLRTLMSTDRDYERAPNVSNPNAVVFFSAYKTGEEGVADNAKTVRAAMETTSLLGEEPIFIGNFESGDFTGWTIGDPASP